VIAYITGSLGFVGRWLAEHLRTSGDTVRGSGVEVDVTDPASIRDAVTSAAPDVVYHLAGLAHVGRSWDDPLRTFQVNTIGTLNVLEAAASCASSPRVIVVSSAEVYGAAGAEPVPETAPLRPTSPYAGSKAAAEYVALQQHLGRGLPIVIARPFNHVGPGQAPDFVVSGLARRVVLAEREGNSTVAVGNLDAERDFTDVRDVVRAYRLLALEGRPGEAYNIASGTSRKVRDVAEWLICQAHRPVELVRDASLVRPVDVPIFLGDASKLVSTTGWSPAVEFDQTLKDVLDYWRKTA
jgi:GDP-4-dehydro-6-deoxy-D-mannose reductase